MRTGKNRHADPMPLAKVMRRLRHQCSVRLVLLTWQRMHCRAGFQMLVALIVIAVSLSQMVPAPTWLGWYTLAFILLFDSAYAWSCECPGPLIVFCRPPARCGCS